MGLSGSRVQRDLKTAMLYMNLPLHNLLNLFYGSNVLILFASERDRGAVAGIPPPSPKPKVPLCLSS